MTDHPIIFSGPMVRALLDGRKTMTRRLAWRYTNKGAPDSDDLLRLPTTWQKVRPGDRLWVREAAAVRYQSWQIADGHRHSVQYAADSDENGCRIGSGVGAGIRKGEAPTVFPKRSHRLDGTLRWQPSIHMPRWASRLTLVVTATKLERLQDISATDSVAEGIECDTCRAMGQSACQRRGCFASQAAFAELWKTLHGPYSWDTNPEVVAISFTVHKTNIDQMKEAA